MSRRILIVEDDPSTQILLKRMVDRIGSGYRATCVSTAEEAYWRLNENADTSEPFDLVIADLCLPGSDGLELWKRAQEHHPAVDFLFVSGTTYRDWESRLGELSPGPDFLRKPITEETLRRFLDVRFNGAGQASG